MGLRRSLSVFAVLGLVSWSAGSGGDEGTAARPDACVSRADVAPSTDVSAASGATEVDADFEARWAELIAAAQAEGELVGINGDTGPGEVKVREEFTRQFGIAYTVTSGNSEETTSRLLAERAQDLYTVDIANLGGSGTDRLLEAGVYQPLMPHLIHPEALDRSTGSRLDYIPWHESDAEKQYVTLYLVDAQPNIIDFYYNTDNVTDEDLEQLQSWQDFLDPRWAGRIGLGNVPKARMGEIGSTHGSCSARTIGTDSCVN